MVRHIVLWVMALAAGAAWIGCSGGSGPFEWVPPDREPVNPVTFDAGAVALDEAVFTQGVMAGDPGAGSMLLWTHVTQDQGLRLKVWIPDIDPQQPELVDLIVDSAVVPDERGYVHQRVEVVPGVWHTYAFFTEIDPGQPTGRSPVGRFTAAPPDGALVRLTFSGTHGTHYHEAPYPTLVNNAAFEPFTLYVHLGDSIYSDSIREPAPPEACTMDEYLAFWQDSWQTEGFRAVLAGAVYLPVPDDHEVANNYHAEFVDQDCPDRVQNGKNAFFEANPIQRAPDAPWRLWRSWRWGDTVEFFALDARSERMPSTSDDPFADPPVVSPDAVFLSPEQMAWLKRGLGDSPAVFKLVLNSVPIIAMPNPPWLNVCDTWACYSSQRQGLIDFIVDNAVTNVFFLSGDFHMALVGRLDPPGGRGHGLFEFFVGPGAQSNPLGDREFIIEQLGEAFDPLPPDQFPWGYPSPTMTYVDLDPLADPPVLTVRYYDPEGTELFRATFAAGQLVDQP